MEAAERQVWQGEVRALERDAAAWMRYAEHLEQLAIQQRVRAENAEAEVQRKKAQLQSVEEELGFSEARVKSLKEMIGEADRADTDPLETTTQGSDAETSVVVEQRQGQPRIAAPGCSSPQHEHSGSEDSAYEPFAAYEPYNGRPSRSSSRAAETTDYEDYDENDDDDGDDDGVLSFASSPSAASASGWPTPRPQMALVTSTRMRPQVADLNEEHVERRAPVEPPAASPPARTESLDSEDSFVHAEALAGIEDTEGNSGERSAASLINTIGSNSLRWVRERVRRHSF